MPRRSWRSILHVVPDPAGRQRRPQICPRPVDRRGDPQPSAVHRRQELPPALQRLSEYQSGVLSREQTLAHHLSDKVAARFIASGTWQRLGNGLYLTHPLAPAWESLAWGGILLGGPRSRLGPEASGYRHKLRSGAPDPLDILVPVDKLVQSRDHWHFHRERPGARSGRSVGSPPGLGVEDAVLDLANVKGAAEVVGLVTTAVQRRLTTPERLRRNLGRRSRHAHRDLVLGMLADVRQGA